MKVKKVLITGGAGFIGSHLCEFFLKKNYAVVCVDNLFTGKKENINHLLKNPSFKFIKADITNKADYKRFACDYSLILHFASPAGPNPYSPKSYLKYPLQTYFANSFGTQYLLELAKKSNASFVFASTSEVYGNPLQHPQTENYWGNVNPIGPRSCYDESKRFGEMITITYGKKYKINTKIVRIFNTYGPKMNPDDGRVIPQFILQALKNKPITIYGSGEQTRSFCYIDDLIEGIDLIINKAKSYDVFNLGNDKEVKIIELAKLIKKITSSQSKLIFKPLPKDDPEKRKPDLTKIKNQLGWFPKTPLLKGLQNTINFFKERKKR